MTVFWVSYALWFAVEMGILSRDRRPVAGDVSDGGSRTLIITTMLGSLAIAFFLAGHRAFAIAWPPMRAVGIALMWAGIALRVWAVLTLGEFFRTRVTMLDTHRLVGTGPYRLIRHPAYTGCLLTCLGIGVALANWASLAVMLAGPATAFAFRIRVEEKALSQRFAESWAAHRRATWALLPPIW